MDREWPIFVWWDLGSCPLPSGYDALRVFDAIKSAMNELGFCGRLSVDAVAVDGQVRMDTIYRLRATGIRCVPVYLSCEPSIAVSIYRRINKWKKSHDTTGVVVVISSDRGYGVVLRALGDAGFRTGIVYMPAYPSEMYLEMVEFHFSLNWCLVLDKAPELDPREYGFGPPRV